MEKKDISKEDLQRVQVEFDRHPKIVALRQKQAALQRSGHYVEAIAVGQTIKRIYNTTLENLIKETTEKFSKVDLAKASLPPEVRKMVMILIITIFMASDIIESSVLDFNELLHKHLGNDYDLTMFRSLQDALKKGAARISLSQFKLPIHENRCVGRPM